MQIFSKHEYEFLLGSMVLDALLTLKIGRAWKIIRASTKASADSNENYSQTVARLLELDAPAVSTGNYDRISNFDAQYRGSSPRFALGHFLSGINKSPAMVLLFPLTLFGAMLVATFKRLALPQSSPPLPKISKQELDNITAPLADSEDEDLSYLLEIERDMHHIDAPVEDIRGPKQDIGEPLDIDEIETEQGLMSVETTMFQKRLVLENMLTDLGFHNTGIRVEPYAESLIKALDGAEVSKVFSLYNDTHAEECLAVLANIISDKHVGVNAKIYLSRLASFMQCLKHGVKLPERAAVSAYTPISKRILMAMHMRGPYESNGYVTRTQFILRSIKRTGAECFPVTRLGYPNDLAKHKKLSLPAQETFDEFEFYSMPDAEGGLVRRPIEEYINAYADGLVKMATKLRVESIHAVSNNVNGLAAIIAARRLGIQCIYEVRGVWEITQASHNPHYKVSLKYDLQRRLENQAIQSVDKVITISEPLRHFLHGNGAKAESTYVVPNGVDANQIVPTPKNYALKRKAGFKKNDVIFGYVGSLVHYEGLDLLLKALAKLNEFPDVNFGFLVVGDGPQFEPLKQLATELGLDDVCIFTGRLPREEALKYFSIIDVTPLPRRSLPVTELVPPLKPFEAMAAAKAVIVSSVAAMADTVVEGETGLTFKCNNVEDLTAALWNMATQDVLRETMSERARSWVMENRSIASLAEKLELVYSKEDC